MFFVFIHECNVCYCIVCINLIIFILIYYHLLLYNFQCWRWNDDQPVRVQKQAFTYDNYDGHWTMGNNVYIYIQESMVTPWYTRSSAVNVCRVCTHPEYLMYSLYVAAINKIRSISRHFMPRIYLFSVIFVVLFSMSHTRNYMQNAKPNPIRWSVFRRIELNRIINLRSLHFTRTNVYTSYNQTLMDENKIENLFIPFIFVYFIIYKCANVN